MTRVIITTLSLLAALAGCRSPSPTANTYTPYGPQTVPPPVTGSIGTPAPQAAPYYQGSSTTTLSPQPGSIGWRPPSTNLGAQPLVQTQPNTQTVTANPQVFASAPPLQTNQPRTNFTSTHGQQFTTPQVTNPATIGSQPNNNAVLGSGTHSAQTQPWQPSAAPIGQPQFLPANAPPTTQPVFNGQPVQPNTSLQPIPAGQPVNNWSQPPNTNWGQPPLNNGSQIQPMPGGMHVNNATYAYNANPSPWSMDGVTNWFRTTFTPTTYPTQQTYQAQPIYQGQQQAAVGYSTTAPTPAPLPVRGMQQNVYPASYPTGQQTVTGGASLSGSTNPPPAMQWGSVPMANSTQTATVRGNDDTPFAALGFVTSSQSSPTPHDAELFSNHAQYHWLRGKLEYSTTQRRWKLRYIPLDAPEGRMDAYGGSVVLTDHADLKQFESGDHVMVQGRLGQGGGSNSYAPLYTVQSVTGL